MFSTVASGRRLTVWSVLTALIAALLVSLTPSPGEAVVSPVKPRSDDVVTADALPTAQINGVAWDQAVVGDAVYVGGRFTQARPAGSPSGTNQSARANLMSYTLSTGVMTAWNPAANAQVRTIAVSPDGSRIYIGGDFTQVAGEPRSRIAAFSTSSGQLISSFAPPVGYQVNDIVATNTTVYVAGAYAGVGSQPRANLSAFDASSGALLGWAPSADRPVLTIDLSEDGSEILAGGHFETINGSPARGLAKIDAATGALLPWPVLISNAGADAAINSLEVRGDVVFGTGFHFGPGGNQEGPWQLRVSTGELVWVADCHGDSYDVHPDSALYVVGHAHYCGNTSMGFPQYSNWRFQHNMAWTLGATGENIREVHGYADWDGHPSPSTMAWLPSMGIGSFTGMAQAGWTVEGSGDYVVIGGEFPTVNGTGQQGLVRFAKSTIAPGNRGPAFIGNSLIPTLQVVDSDAVKVSWRAGYDQDDHELTYQVVRTGSGVVHETKESSTWWDVPGLAWVDRGLTPGQTYNYSIRVRDGSGNQVFGSTRSVTVPDTFERNAYGEAVLASEPQIYWPLNEVSGTVMDHAGGYPGTPGSAVTYGVAGAIAGDTAVSVNNSSNGRVYAEPQSHAPTEMSAQVWFRTSASSGRLLGFGDLATGNSAHRDRQIYLNNNGRVNFGVRADGAKVLTSPTSYNDNQWHQAVATLEGESARLYVDGRLVAQRHDITRPEQYVGHWRLGGDSQSGWPNSPGNSNFTGGMDEVSIYDRALTPQEVNAHYVASGRTSQLPPDLLDEYGQLVQELEPDLYWRLGETSGSSAADSSIMNNGGSYQGGHTKGVPGALAGVEDTGVRFNGNDGYAVSDNAFSNPVAFSTEAWFRTTTANGGKIIGFGNNRTSLSSSYDRHTFMLNDGRVTFGVYNGAEYRVTSSESYNDGEWHHVVSSISKDGMQLYVDGQSVDSSTHTLPENFTGYWRAGGDRVWSGASSNFFDGDLDEVAVYSRPLTSERVQQHFLTGSNTVPNVGPTSAFTHDTDHLNVVFDASESADEDGNIVAFTWDFGDGNTGSGVQVNHGYEESGTYDVTLTVTDDDGATDEVTHTIEVVANEPPVAMFDHEVSHLQVDVDASQSADIDGSIVSYEWDFGDGTALSGPARSHVYDEAGSYEITLTVTDDDGSQDTANQVVTVAPAPPNQAPVAAFDAEVTHLMVEVDASESSDSDGELVSYVWDFGDGSAGTGLLAGRTYQEAGTYLVTLTVTDDQGATDTTSRNVTVEAPPSNVPPEADFTVSAEGLAVTVDGRSSVDSDGEIVSWIWDFGDGNTDTGAEATHAYAESGTFTITLTVVDDDGAEHSASQPVQVTAPPANEAPRAAFASATAGLTATFDGSESSDPDGTLLSWEWEFGDGETATGAVVVHSFAQAGTYDVTLTVTDDAGEQDVVTDSVTVTAPPPVNEPPVADFSSSSTGLLAAFDGSASSDPDGSVVSWTWNFGDGITDSGVTVQHTYSQAGDYQVTLTVVDDAGASSDVTLPVTVLASPAGQTFVLDSFTRSVPNGWEAADVGGSWVSTNNASLFSVADGVGRMTLPNAGSNVTIGLPSVSAQDVDATVDLTFDKAPSGSGTYGTLMVRRDGSDSYRLRARVMPTSTMILLTRVSGGSEVVLSNTTVPWVYQPGEVIRLRLVAEGTSPTELRGKVWRVGDPEPSTWQVSAVDSTAALQRAGAVGIYNYVGGSVTNAPVLATVDNLNVSSAGQPAPNALPVGAFTLVNSQLTVDVDGSASTDTDGEVVSWAWTFGDGAIASGPTASHTYTEPGTYVVTLTVTDDDGAQHVVSREVTVSEQSLPQAFALDSFTRSVSSGWAAADVGGSWVSTNNASLFSVADGVGRMTLPNAGANVTIGLPSVSAQDVEATVDLAYDKEPTGSGTYGTLMVRRDGSDSYRLRARLMPTSTMILLTRVSGGSELVLSNTTVPWVYQPGEVIRLRLVAEGTSPTELRGKVWRVGDPEPSTWQVSAVDSTAALQRAGAVAIYNYLGGSVTNAPVVGTVDNLNVSSAE